jgi:hypothetical protein
MKKKIVTLGVLLATLLPGAKADVDPNFYIYLCFGQSNMEGNAQPESVDKTGVPERFQMLACVNFNSPKRTMGQWYKAVPPLVRESTGLGMADWFGRTMVQSLPENIKIGVVDVAIGGTKIEGFMQEEVKKYIASMNPSTESWLINYFKAYNNDPFQRLVDMAKIAQKSGVIRGILLHQGCSNNGDQSWPQKVKKIYDRLIDSLSLNAAEVPLFVGELVSQAAGGACYGHNTIINTVPKVIPNSYVISSKDCPQGAQKDNLHFSALGYRMMGYRYAVSALATMGLKPPYFSFSEGALTANVNSTYTSSNKTMKAAKAGGMVTWNYAEGADWSDYKYLVIKLKKNTCDGEVMISNLSPSKIAFREAFGDKTTFVVDLQNAKNGSVKLDPAKVGKVQFRAAKAGDLTFDDVFLSNDEAYAPTAIHSVNIDSPFQAPLYSLDGRLALPDALKPGIYIRSGKKIVIR